MFLGTLTKNHLCAGFSSVFDLAVSLMLNLYFIFFMAYYALYLENQF